MKTAILALTALCLAMGSSHAQLTSNKMMKIVARDTSPDTPSDSFGAKPKTLYRMGETYGRSEEMPDPDQGIHGLTVIAEPKIWMINLWDKTGRLIIDPGPTYVFRASIIPPEGRNQRPPLRDFEFGREYEFLRLHKATGSQEPIRGKPYDVLSVSLDGYALKLFSTKGEDKPFRVVVSKAGRVLCQYDYDEYKTDLPPRMDLFKPPDGVKIVETAEPSADADGMKSLEDFGQRVMAFYQSPSPEGFARFQKDADRLESVLTANGNGADVALAVGMARTSAKHHWPIEGKGHAARQAKEILEGKSELARYVNDDTAVDPAKLDIWWMSFFATGDTAYLEKLLEFAGEPMPKDDLDKMLVIGAATWSFKSNCRQHKTVREFARSQLKNDMSPEKKAFLVECAKQGKNDKGP